MEEKDSSVAEPEEEESGQPELRKISPEELKKVLEEHEKWIVSQGKEGTEAHLQKANLREANLRGALGLTVEQLSQVKTLYWADLDERLMEQIKKNYTHLLEEPKSE